MKGRVLMVKAHFKAPQGLSALNYFPFLPCYFIYVSVPDINELLNECM